MCLPGYFGEAVVEVFVAVGATVLFPWTGLVFREVVEEVVNVRELLELVLWWTLFVLYASSN